MQEIINIDYTLSCLTKFYHYIVGLSRTYALTTSMVLLIDITKTPLEPR